MKSSLSLVYILLPFRLPNYNCNRAMIFTALELVMRARAAFFSFRCRRYFLCYFFLNLISLKILRISLVVVVVVDTSRESFLK